MGFNQIRDVSKMLFGAFKYYKKVSSSDALNLQRTIARNYVNTIPDAQWEKMSKAIFQQADELKSPFVQKLSRTKETLIKSDIEIPSDIEDSFNYLERKGNIFFERFQVAKSMGKTPKNTCIYGSKFKNSHKEHFDKIETFLTEKADVLHKKAWQDFGASNEAKIAQENYSQINKLKSELSRINSTDLYNPKISLLADDILTEGQKFYHGTTHQSAIRKNGFSLNPKPMQATFASRELGEAVYITPNKDVASYYAGLTGSILPLEVNLQKVAAVNNNQQGILNRTIAKVLGLDVARSPMNLERIINELFKRNGYNAAYTREALGSDLFSQRDMIDALSGGKQSQLAVFNPDDIKILSKNILDKLENQKMQIASFSRIPKSIYKSLRPNKS